MSDPALNSLARHINSSEELSLWLADENIGTDALSLVSSRPSLTVITNRYTLFQALIEQGFQASLSDFDFSSLEKNSFDVIYYRVSKEKPVVHHMINQAGEYLKAGGHLIITGHKNEGTKTYIDKAKKYLGGSVELTRGDKGMLTAQLENTATKAAALDDKNYHQERSILSNDTEFISKPGVYGWNKIDKGSQFLIDNLGLFLEQVDLSSESAEPLKIIDLGCGYGYLSVCAHKLINAEFIATDNNITAVEMCKKNFSLHQLVGEVLVDDCGSTIQSLADVVLCNPPFHQGFETSGDLTSRFLASAHRILKKHGVALFVVNSFIGIEKKAKGLFSTIEVFENNGSFKLITLRK